MDRKDVVIAIVVRQGNVLICQRKHTDPFGGYWEFPGGKREPGESAEQCLRRELEEELALRVTPIDQFMPIEHDYALMHVRLLPYLCECDPGEPQPIGCERLAWIAPAQLHNYRFPEANGPLIPQIIQRLSGATIAT